MATNAAAQGHGTGAEFLEYKRTNFVLVVSCELELGAEELEPSELEIRIGSSAMTRRYIVRLYDTRQLANAKW